MHLDEQSTAYCLHPHMLISSPHQVLAPHSTPPHTPHLTLRTSPLTLQRLSSLHLMGIVDYATVGYVQSDAATWRNFWTISPALASALASEEDTERRSGGSGRGLSSRSNATRSGRLGASMRGVHVVPCVSPHRPCSCALCLNRGASIKRTGARASRGGGGGAFVSGLADMEQARTTCGEDDDDFDGPHNGSHASGLGRVGGLGGPGERGRVSSPTVGTRITGVLRVRADSAAAALDGIAQQPIQPTFPPYQRATSGLPPSPHVSSSPHRLIFASRFPRLALRVSRSPRLLAVITANLASSLHEATGPMSVPESERSIKVGDGLYDVQWSELRMQAAPV